MVAGAEPEVAAIANIGAMTRAVLTIDERSFCSTWIAPSFFGESHSQLGRNYHYKRPWVNSVNANFWEPPKIIEKISPGP